LHCHAGRVDIETQESRTRVPRYVEHRVVKCSRTKPTNTKLAEK